MKTHPEIERLRALDPAPAPPHDPARADQLLQQILAEPRPRPPRRWWKRRPRVGGLTLAAAAAVAAVVIVLSGGTVASSLLDRAYAAVNPRDQVLHEVDVQTQRGVPGWSDRLEGWLLPADGRARLVNVWGYKRSPFVTEAVITATGNVYSRTCLAYCHPASFTKGRSGWNSEGKVPPGTFGGPQALPGTFAQWFRTAYQEHAVVRDGTTTFDGHRVARFQSVTGGGFFWRPGTPPPMSARVAHGLETLLDWYIDPATAQPLGFRAWGCMTGPNGSCEPDRGPADGTTRIVAFERLDPTSQNLADLTAPGLPAGS